MLIPSQVHYFFFPLSTLRYLSILSFLYFWFSCREVTANKKLTFAVTVFYDPTHVHAIATILIFAIGISVPLCNSLVPNKVLSYWHYNIIAAVCHQILKHCTELDV